MTSARRAVHFGALALSLAALVAAAGCSGTNRLKDYDFRDRTAAVVAAFPPRPAIFTDHLATVDLDLRNPIGTVVRVGTAMAKEVEVRKAQVRMDSALLAVDVAERMAERALLESARHLRYRPIDDPDAADFVLDVRVREYGLDATAWNARVQFVLDADVLLVDNATGRLVWRRHVKEREPVSDAVLGLGPAFGNAYTAYALSALSVEEMTVALEHLADFAAGRLALHMREDRY